MEKYDFAIIFNTRNRSSMLYDLLQSIKVNTYDLSNLEVLIGVDDNDETNIDFVKDFAFAQTIVRPQVKNIHTMLNDLARRTNSTYIFGINDDCRIITYGWDIIMKQTLDTYLEDKPDGVVLGQTQDNSVDKIGNYTSFPVIPRASMNALGVYMAEDFPYHGGDVLLHRIYQSVDRVLPINVHVYHVLHDNPEHVIKLDKTGQEMRAETFKNPMNYYEHDIEKYTRKLRDHINNTPS